MKVRDKGESKANQFITILTEAIKAKTKELWGKDGCKQGNDLVYWLEAGMIAEGQTNK